TIWADDGNQYTMMDDGGTDLGTRSGFWRQSMAVITGTPPHIRIAHVGDPNSPPPHTYAQIGKNQSLWAGPLGPYYSSGLVEAGHVFFATEQLNWHWGANGLFAGLRAIAYSADRGRTWNTGAQSFPAPLGNLSWVIRGQGGVYADGYVYAIASEREFNAGRLILGRSRTAIADVTNPARWQWQSGWQRYHGQPWPVWSRSLAAAVPTVSWGQHITYPQIAYDSPLHRYLLTFTYSYANTVPGIWKDGSDLVILEGPHPWGPFSFVAHEPDFGPSNGYAPGIPIKWISGNGRDLWLKWSANFAGCASGLDCSGGYGFNYRKLHLTLASASSTKSGGVAAPG
ncbi:MAG: DUF4185 domain-containing protein, partial [Actinomycetota bacterium]|nr:DUF4185 domain-containing protein [Actinomycetota bacterium]